MDLNELDLIDRKLLAELDKSARSTYSEIGKKLRIAKETVKFRISRLEKANVIRGYYTVINIPKVGFTVYRPYIRLKDTTPEIENEIIQYLLNSKNVVILFHTNGSYHLALAIWAKDAWEYELFWKEFKKLYGNYFSNYVLSVMIEYKEFTRTYLLRENKLEKEAFNTISKVAKEPLDEIDIKLLAFLSDNARASFVQLAEHLKITVGAVRYRMNHLIKRKIILGFRAIINLQSIGMEYYKVDLWLRKFDRIEEVKQFILSNPNVIYTETSLVTSDVEFDIEVENFNKFIEIMNSFKEKFPEEIKDYTYYSLIKNYKTQFMPSL